MKNLPAMKRSDPNVRMKKWFSILILVLLNIYIGFACYDARGKNFSYLFDSVHSLWYNSKLAKITEEGHSLCPPDTGEFCKTPCWNGFPYEEPEFLLTPNCTEYSSRQALVYFYSSLNNHQIRQSVRRKFEKSLFQDDMKISLIFVVGIPSNKSDDGSRVMIENEHKMYGDIMQISIVDVYTKLTYKDLAVFKWVQQCKEKTKYIAKLDDDSLKYIDIIDTILFGFKAMQENYEVVQNSIVCLFPLYDFSAYDKRAKEHWESNFHQYYSTKLPTYCQGKWGIFLTPQVAWSLYKAGRGLPLYHLGDVYSTGILRERACLEISNYGTISKFLLGLLTKTLHRLVELFAYELVLKDFDRKEKECHNGRISSCKD